MAWLECFSANQTAESELTVDGKSSARAQSLESSDERFEYYDAGNHWCKNCNVTSGSMFDFFTHLHSKSHRKTLDPYNRPWASHSESEKKHLAGELISKPAKGSEFLLPVRGFFCQLCKQFFGDPICAEAHVTCHVHNEKYKKQISENPLYEQRRNLDRQAGMKSEKKQSEHKRKHDVADSQDEQKTSKSSRDVKKKPKYKDEDDDRHSCSKEMEQKAKYIKEEESKAKIRKEEFERIKSRKEEEKIRYAKDEWERNKYRKEEEERYRQRKMEEDRYKSEEGNRYKYKEDDKYKYRKEDEKSGYRRDEEKKYKHGQETEDDKRPKYKKEEELKHPKSKLEEEEGEEEKPGKYGKKEDKCQNQKDKAGGRNEEKSAKDVKIESGKPSELPKVLCGPSPAMLAKLRKKNEEGSSRMAFGKLSWKKPEKTALEKEAERVAAQFIKEEEESVAAAQEENKDSEDQDPFAKSVAAAKSIAIKLSGKSAITPSEDWVSYNQNKVRPTLQSPPNVLRKSSVGLQNKPATVDTASPVGPSTDTSSKSPAPVMKRQQDKTVLSVDLVSKTFSGEQVQLEIPEDKLPSSSSASVTPTTTTAPIFTVQEVKAVEPKAPTEVMIKLDPDVAAPGVPEDERKLMVIVRPPPLLQTSTSLLSSKPDKPKTSLAAAKAQDLFNIFYGGGIAMASPSICSAGKKTNSNPDSKADSESQVTVHNDSTKEEGLPTPDSKESIVDKSEPPNVDQIVHEDSRTDENSEHMEPTVDYKDKAETLDCLASSEIMDNIEMLEANDIQNPLDSEEAMTLSFSPTPGSFTEQLNLDTFEFSFEL